MTTSTSFTPEQTAAIDGIVDSLVDHCIARIDAETERILGMDKRTRKTFDPADPDAEIFMPYANQGMLEELIAKLEECV